MQQVDHLGVDHLSAQTRLWLAELLPAPQARERLVEAKQIAVKGSRKLLIREAERLLGAL